jgi:drug/metabolite transporter (DMT)-like permease
VKSNGLTGGVLLVLGSTLFFAFKPILVRIGLDQGLEPMQFVTLRLAVALPLFLITVVALGRAREMKLDAGEFWHIGLVSVTGMGGAMLFSFYSIQHLGASVSTLVIFIFPAITTVMSYFVNARLITRGKVYSLATSFAGLFLVILPMIGSTTPTTEIAGYMPTLGLFYALLCAFCWSGTQVAFERLTQRQTPFVIAAYTTGFMLLFFLIVNGVPPVDLEQKTWIVILLLGSVGWYVPFLLAIYGIKMIGASNSSIIQSLGPAITVLIAWLLLGETLYGLQVAGMIFLIAAVYILRNESDITDKAASITAGGIHEADAELRR